MQVISYLQDPSVGVCHRDINPNNIMINHEGYFTSLNTHSLYQIDSSLAVNNSPFLHQKYLGINNKSNGEEFSNEMLKETDPSSGSP